MPNLPPPHQDGPVNSDADLAALLAGTRDAAPGLQPVADVLAALGAEPSAGELAGEAGALGTFRRIAGRTAGRQRAHRRRAAALASRLSAKVAAAAMAVAVVLGGAATASFANALPAPIQRFAHAAIDAPEPPRSPHPPPARGKAVIHRHPASRGKPAVPAGLHATGRPGIPRPAARPSSRTGPQGQQGNGQGQSSGQGSSNRAGQRGGPHTMAAPGAHPARPAPSRTVMHS